MTQLCPDYIVAFDPFVESIDYLNATDFFTFLKEVAMNTGRGYLI